MDYEQKYNEALERARKLYNDAKANEYKSDMEDYEFIFHELAESEGERIRKALIEVFKEKLERGFEWVEYGIPNRSVLDWLEKQKEQKPAEWSEEDEKILKLLILNIGRYMYFGGMSSERILSFLKSLRPQQRQEWSEEEKEILDSILSHYVLIDKPTDANGISKEKYISLIKSIRFDTYKNCNSHWNPSEEQMKALDKAIPVCMGVVGRDAVAPLESLYEQLKAL